MSAKTIIGLILVAMVLSLLPFALIARSRATRSARPAPHVVLDMDKQPRFDPQSPNRMFADGRAMRPQVAGTVAREDLQLRTEALTVATSQPRMIDGAARDVKVESAAQYAALLYGRVRAAGVSDADFSAAKPPAEPNQAGQNFYVSAFPPGVNVTEDFVRRGQERFNIYCAPCHGQTGLGDGMIQRRVSKLQDTKPEAITGWVPPSNLTDAERRGRPLGHLYNTIAQGIRNMPAYDKQISVMDRWAIVAYVKALQRSQGGTTEQSAK